MSFAAKSVLEPMPVMTNGCLISCPSHFTRAKASDSRTYLSISWKPIKFQLSCSYSLSTLHPLLFSLKRKERLLKLSVIAGQQEESSPAVIEDEQQFKWEASGNEESFGAVEDVELSEDAKVYEGNFPYDVDSEMLAQIFGRAGVVEMAEVIYKRETDRSRGFGFVTMSTVEEAEKAVELFHRYDINGRLLTVSKASPRGSRPECIPRVSEPIFRIYVGNLSWSMDDLRLEQLFSEYGKVTSARVVLDRETGRSRGFGFVTMSRESELNDAIANLDGQNLDERMIQVNVAEERPRRSF